MSGHSQASKRKWDENDVPDVSPTLRDLMVDGIPFHTFIRNSSKSTLHYSDHEKISSGGQGPLPFGILDNLPDILRKAKYRYASNVLMKLALTRANKEFHYCNETEIQNLVSKLLEDVLELLSYSDQVSIKPEIALSKVKYIGKGANKADFWLLLTSTNRPIMIVEVKSPNTPSVLKDGRVRGQVWDYLMDVMSFYGLYHVIGVSTTFEEWCFHWYPHSDAYAASTAPPVQPASPAPALDMVQMALERELHSSAVVHHTDEDLMPMLLSAVVKGMHSPHAAVPMIDPHRAYIRITRDHWAWARIAAEDTSKLTFNLDKKARRSTGFLVIKYFFRDTEKKVWLTVAEPSQQIVVAKVFQTDAEAEAERDCWERVNGAAASFCTKLRESWALCTPFVIQATETNDGSVSFGFDVAEWARQTGADAGQPPAAVAAFSARLQELGGGMDVREVARRAIERAAKAGVVHKDLAWRHIALMPVFGEQDGVQRVQRLEPVLLDFGKVEIGVDPSAALQAMEEALEKM